jgi:ornithine decarboxylase
VLAGPTCDGDDVLYREVALPEALRAGDTVRLLAAGAYTASYASVGFNGLPPLAVTCTDSARCPGPADPARCPGSADPPGPARGAGATRKEVRA